MTSVGRTDTPVLPGTQNDGLFVESNHLKQRHLLSIFQKILTEKSDTSTSTPLDTSSFWLFAERRSLPLPAFCRTGISPSHRKKHCVCVNEYLMGDSGDSDNY